MTLPATANRIHIVLLVLLTLAACVDTSADIRKSGGNPREAARVNTRLGLEYMRQGDTTSARGKLERAVEEDPTNADAQAGLALLYAQMGESDKADRRYQKALDLDPENASLLNNYGVFLCGQKQSQRAEGYFRRAAESARYATPEAAWTNAGVCMRKVPDISKAEGYFRQALQANPNFPDALGQMLLLNVDRGNYLEARAFMQRYESVATPSVEILKLAIRTELALGDRAAVDRYTQQLNALDQGGGSAASQQGMGRDSMTIQPRKPTQSPE